MYVYYSKSNLLMTSYTWAPDDYLCQVANKKTTVLASSQFIPQGIRAKEVQDLFFFGQDFVPDQEEPVADEGDWDMKSMLVRYLHQAAVSLWQNGYTPTLNSMSTGTAQTASAGGIQRYLRQKHTKNRIFTRYDLF